MWRIQWCWWDLIPGLSHQRRECQPLHHRDRTYHHHTMEIYSSISEIRWLIKQISTAIDCPVLPRTVSWMSTRSKSSPLLALHVYNPLSSFNRTSWIDNEWSSFWTILRSDGSIRDPFFVHVIRRLPNSFGSVDAEQLSRTESNIVTVVLIDEWSVITVFSDQQTIHNKFSVSVLPRKLTRGQPVLVSHRLLYMTPEWFLGKTFTRLF